MYAAITGPRKDATDADCASAYEAGRRLAQAGAVVVTGGMDGVMAAASRGAVVPDRRVGVPGGRSSPGASAEEAVRWEKPGATLGPSQALQTANP